MYKSVIGLEIHAQLLTKTKLFCSCSTNYGDPPNTNVCPVCLGYPGALPVLNKEAVKMAVKAALALNCRINSFSSFDRKNYFYPDLPKGYQITQFFKPFAEDGYLEINLRGKKKKIRIERIHIEEDAGKSIHNKETNKTFVDFNRSGVPLIEIVTKPDMESPDEAAEFLKTLRQTLMYIDVNDGNLEEGSLRCDANVSIHKEGEPLGTRVEIKNLNSFRFIQKAIKYEIEDQKKKLESGEKVFFETKLYDSRKNKTYTMRSKEALLDYRYFPEPDLQILEIKEEEVENIKSEIEELPVQKAERFMSEYKLSFDDASLLTSSKYLANYYEKIISYNKLPKKTANWLLSELLRYIKDIDTEFVNPPISPENFAKFIEKIEKREITGPIAKEILPELLKNKKDVETIIKEKGIKSISSDEEILNIINQVLEDNREQVIRYKEGKTKLFGFFVGQVMKATKGAADPKKVNTLLKEALNVFK